MRPRLSTGLPWGGGGYRRLTVSILTRTYNYLTARLIRGLACYRRLPTANQVGVPSAELFGWLQAQLLAQRHLQAPVLEANGLHIADASVGCQQVTVVVLDERIILSQPLKVRDRLVHVTVRKVIVAQAIAHVVV